MYCTYVYVHVNKIESNDQVSCTYVVMYTYTYVYTQEFIMLGRVSNFAIPYEK